MTRRDEDRLDDVSAAIVAIRAHLSRGPLSDGLVSDAIRIRLLEIGEAVNSLSKELTTTEPGIPWQQVARMRDLAHRYFMTEVEIIRATVDNDLGPFAEAVDRMRASLPPDTGTD